MYNHTKIHSNLLDNTSSLDELVRQFIEETVNYLIQTELDEFLGYQTYDHIGFNSGNSRNGSYTRTIDTQFGSIEVTIPRDRNGEFKQKTIPSYQRRTDELESTIIHLYSKGVTTQEISELIEKMYGHHYTPQLQK